MRRSVHALQSLTTLSFDSLNSKLRQLRPVTHRGICDLTHLYLTSYSQIYSGLGSPLPSLLRHHIQCQFRPLRE